MKKRLLTIGAIAAMSMCMLTGCSTKKAYENDVDVFNDCIKEAEQLKDSLEEEYEEKGDKAITKCFDDMRDVLDKAHIQTQEGKEFKTAALDYWDYYTEWFIADMNGEDIDDTDNYKDELAFKFVYATDLFDDFLDAATENGVYTSELEEACDEYRKLY